ncbi:NAD(P)H-hydrate dehydratase [Tenacibaculum caenipelagi]|uniref:Bifunctional NAD(P)H-hydrate repair enzyme n=1 Tax=Tenacibaculum caenipelagi TaxID=1325435 RepID=A0A4R6TLD6_9FLAO|nr:NAD(P)H-hydrate dehydratase [Tenacibaculum caenipelagi]TDQ29840.1 NAD(P)H-hydrate epimerase [Tenacibaculum caenipelagi]
MDNLQKILDTSQIRKTDKHTIAEKEITSFALMGHAALAFVSAIEPFLLHSQKIAIVCGIGNNGGDGFAVARILRSKKYKVHPILIQFKETLSPDCNTNFQKLNDTIIVKSNDHIPNFSEYDVIIDAIFGSGLSKPITGFVQQVIESINQAKKTVYSIDIPSGLYCDELSNSETIIQADLVVSFQRPKFSFFFPENGNYVKNWKTVDIGLDEVFIQQQSSNYYVLDEQIVDILKPRPRQSHKGSYGHALLIAGSYGKIGAAVLSSRACLRSGVGLLTTYIPKCGYNIIQSTIPEAMCLIDENEEFTTQLPKISKYDIVGIGPGLGIHNKTAKVLKKLLSESNNPLVIDADAINILANNQDLKSLISENSILTPHIKEFDRLAGTSHTSTERFQKQLAFSVKHKCIVVLKNAYTSISSPEGNLYFNTSGNQGMATGGSGDVLTGIITGLLAQNYNSLHAALLAVYFHGKAGDEAANKKGYNALIASDIIEHLRIEKS